MILDQTRPPNAPMTVPQASASLSASLPSSLPTPWHISIDVGFLRSGHQRLFSLLNIFSQAIDGDFTAARAALDDLLTDRGLAGGDVIDQLHRSAWELDLEERAVVRLLERLGEVDYRITEGANERLQLEAMLASLALEE